MSYKYSRSDLLALRESPLVVKPYNLPPAEEWMGVQEPARKSTVRGKTEEGTVATQADGGERRPILLGRRSTTDPERIHLGPPRHFFASSNPKARGSLYEKTKTNEDSETLSDRHGGDTQETGARDVNAPDSRRKARRGDQSIQGESNGEESAPSGHKYTLSDQLEDGNGRNGRSHLSRAKFEQPWARGAKLKELEEEAEIERPAWSKGPRERLHERNESEPEWADIDPAGTTKARTHDDFMQWMASMRNKKDNDGKPQSGLVQKEVVQIPVEIAASAPRVVSDSDAAADRFFARFTESKTDVENTNSVRPTKSRFAAMFGTKEDLKQEIPPTEELPIPAPQMVELEQPLQAREAEQKEKEDAFAKLLLMLNKNQASAASAVAQSTQPLKPQVNIAELDARARSAAYSGDDLGHPLSSHTPILSHTPNISLDRLLESRSPANLKSQDGGKATPTGATDLLKLLQRTTVADRQQNSQGYDESRERQIQPPPGFSHLSPAMRSQQERSATEQRREPPPLMFDDPDFHNPRGTNEEEFQPRLLPRSQTTNDAANLFHSANQENFEMNMQARSQPQPLSQRRAPMPPQRHAIPDRQGPPPGFESQRPPGLPYTNQPQFQNNLASRQIPPPPPPNDIRHLPPYLQHMYQQQSQQREQQQQQQQKQTQPQYVLPMSSQAGPPPHYRAQRKPTNEFANLPPGLIPQPYWTQNNTIRQPQPQPQPLQEFNTPPGFGPPQRAFTSPISPDTGPGSQGSYGNIAGITRDIRDSRDSYVEATSRFEQERKAIQERQIMQEKAAATQARTQNQSQNHFAAMYGTDFGSGRGRGVTDTIDGRVPPPPGFR